MAEPLRHRQTKGAETDMRSLPPPRHIPTLPRLVVLGPGGNDGRGASSPIRHIAGHTLWSKNSVGLAHNALHDYHVLPWQQSTTGHPDHWPEDVGHYWVEARRSIEGENWSAAALMARSALQFVLRAHGAIGNNLKEEIDDLPAKGLILPIMQKWARGFGASATSDFGRSPRSGAANRLAAASVNRTRSS